MQPTTQNANILIFDSGFGGFSIMDCVVDVCPEASITYLSDNAWFPYGLKEESQLVRRTCELLEHIATEQEPDIVIVACNTASTVALPAIRQRISQPVIGVVPAIKPAASLSQRKSIGLLATPGTIQRSYTDELINDFAAKYDWIRVGSSELVEIAEMKVLGESVCLDTLSTILQPFTNSKKPELDTIVLACTHFPLIKKELMTVMPNITNWVDSSQAIAERTRHLLDNLSIGNAQTPPSHRLVFTGDIPKTQKLKILKQTQGFSSVEVLSHPSKHD